MYPPKREKTQMLLFLLLIGLEKGRPYTQKCNFTWLKNANMAHAPRMHSQVRSNVQHWI